MQVHKEDLQYLRPRTHQVTIVLQILWGWSHYSGGALILIPGLRNFDKDRLKLNRVQEDVYIAAIRI